MNTEKKMFFNKQIILMWKNKNKKMIIWTLIQVWTWWCGCLSHPCGQDTQQCCDVLIMAALFTMTQAQRRGIQAFVNLNIILIIMYYYIMASILTVDQNNSVWTQHKLPTTSNQWKPHIFPAVVLPLCYTFCCDIFWKFLGAQTWVSVM